MDTAGTYRSQRAFQNQNVDGWDNKVTNKELCFQFVDLPLPVLQLLSCLIGLKLGLSLQLVEWILKCPMLLQKLLPLQPGMKTW